MLTKKLYREILRRTKRYDDLGLTNAAMQRYAEFLPLGFVIPPPPKGDDSEGPSPATNATGQYPKGTATHVAKRAFRFFSNNPENPYLTPAERLQQEQVLKATCKTKQEAINGATMQAFSFIKTAGEDEKELEMFLLSESIRRHQHDCGYCLSVLAVPHRLTDETTTGKSHTNEGVHQEKTDVLTLCEQVSAELRGKIEEVAAQALAHYLASLEKLKPYTTLSPEGKKTPFRSKKRDHGELIQMPDKGSELDKENTRVICKGGAEKFLAEFGGSGGSPPVAYCLVEALNYAIFDVLKLQPDRSDIFDTLFVDVALVKGKLHPALLASLYIVLLEAMQKIAVATQKGTEPVDIAAFEAHVLCTTDRRRSMVRLGKKEPASPTPTMKPATAVDDVATEEKPFVYLNIAAGGTAVSRREAAYLMTGDAAAKSKNANQALQPQSSMEVISSLLCAAIVRNQAIVAGAPTMPNTAGEVQNEEEGRRGDVSVKIGGDDGLMGPGKSAKKDIADDEKAPEKGEGDMALQHHRQRLKKTSSLLVNLFLFLGASS